MVDKLRVVAGLIFSQNKILLGQRPDNGIHASLWEFPGGKIKNGETPEEALIRELIEELSVSIVTSKFAFQIEYNYSELKRFVCLNFFLVKIDPPVVKNNIYAQLSFFTIDEIRQLDLLEADFKAIPEIEKLKNDLKQIARFNNRNITL